jgi:hypothetical protein
MNNSSTNPFDNSILANQPGRNKSGATRFSAISRWILLLAVLIVPQVVQAQWNATVGAAREDWAPSGAARRDTFPGHFSERWNVPLYLRAA